MSPPRTAGPARRLPLSTAAVGGPLSAPLGAPPGWARGRRANQDQGAVGVVAYAFERLSWLAIVAIFAAHVFFGAEDYPVLVRAILAAPAAVFILEARAYVKNRSGEMPFIALAMLQFYVAFGFAVFVPARFYDLNGPVLFASQTFVSAGLAVLVGCLSTWAGARVGMHAGRALATVAPKLLPPEELPRRWDEAFFVFAGASAFLGIVVAFRPEAIPASVGVALGYLLQLDLVMGMACVQAPRFLGAWMNELILGFSLSLGLLRGQLEPLARTTVAFVSGTWSQVRRVPVWLLAGVVVLFLILQPAKRSYREQVWERSARTGEQIGFAGRIGAWGKAVSDLAEEDRSEGSSAMGRLTELAPAMHALQMIPQRVPYLNGDSFLEILYAPVPRLIWRDKPTTEARLTQRYAVIFGLQTERGARTTAIGLNVLVEGYWNLGWYGIVIACFGAGLSSGASQSLFKGHWALRVVGVAQIACVSVIDAVSNFYSQVFQMVVGRLIAIWAIYWFARFLERRRRGASVVGGRRLAHR
jgi:hypothetical protein